MDPLKLEEVLRYIAIGEEEMKIAYIERQGWTQDDDCDYWIDPETSRYEPELPVAYFLARSREIMAVLDSAL